MECKLLEKVKSLSLFENYLMSRDPEVKIFQNINGEQRNLLITSFINVWVYLYVKLGAIPRKVSEGIQYTERNTSIKTKESSQVREMIPINSL